MLLYLRSSQKLLTRVDRHRARQGPTTIDFRVFRLCRRTRAFITSLLDCFTPKPKLWTRWHTEPPPTFPFRKSQCQTARQTDVFTPLFNETPLSQLTSRSGVGAGYRSGLPPSQTLKSQQKRFFCARCGWTFPPLFRSDYRVRSTSIYGASGKFQPAPLILLLRKAGCSAKKPVFLNFGP